MYRFMFFIPLALCGFAVSPAVALETLDALLPTPRIVRGRANDLKVSSAIQDRIERMYREAEPKYHELKNDFDKRLLSLHAALVDEPFDTNKIATALGGLLKSENELKIYQVKVRIRLLSQLNAEQRQGARNYASEEREEASWNNRIVADDTFDSLLPTPFWLRSRAEELGIKAATREQLEKTYQTFEPKYKKLKGDLNLVTEEFIEVVLADYLDEKEIVECFAVLLRAETKLKQYMAHVRASLMSQVSAKQRRATRELIKKKPKADWRKVLSDKVDRVRDLGKQLGDRGEPIADIEQRLAAINELISEGMVSQGGQELNRLIRVLAKRLAEEGSSLASKADGLLLGKPTRVIIDGGIELHFIEQGTGEPILFVHGAVCDCFTWTRQLDGFANAGYRAIAYSRRNNYPNANKLLPNHSGADEARDLALFIRKLDVGRVHLVGFSAGANAALITTLDNPELVRTLTLAEPPLISWLADLPGDDKERGLAMLRQLGGKRVKPVKAALATGDDLGAAREFIDSFGGKGAFDELPKDVQEERVRNINELKAIVSHRRYYPHVDRERVRNLEVPTLVLSADKTTATSELTDRELARLLPETSSKRVIIRDARHIMFTDQPERCLMEVVEFIRESGPH